MKVSGRRTFAAGRSLLAYGVWNPPYPPLGVCVFYDRRAGYPSYPQFRPVNAVVSAPGTEFSPL